MAVNDSGGGAERKSRSRGEKAEKRDTRVL